jgi:hypothetical protein
MAKKRQTFGKMQRERERAEKRARKLEKKEEKKAAGGLDEYEAQLARVTFSGQGANGEGSDSSEPGAAEAEPETGLTPPGDERS